MKRVTVISTGGTIASKPGDDGRNIAGALSGQELLSQVPGINDIDVRVISLFQKDSNSLTLADLQQLRSLCQSIIDARSADGIVITHGTDTLEDTAYFLDTTLQNLQAIALVITGAQRVPHAPGTDTYTNIRDAISAAAAPKCQGLGMLVLFNETIFAAAFAQKTSTYQLNGFDAPGFGFMGQVDGDAVYIYQRPARMPQIDVTDKDLPAVEILASYLDAQPYALDGVIAAGVRGIVLQAVGRGQVPPGWLPSIRKAVGQGVVVLVAGSALHGPLLPCYQDPGSLYELESIGAVAVSGLSARKARLRLMAALAACGAAVLQPSRIKYWFNWT